MSSAVFWLSMIQAGYFFLTGVWPLVHIQSFMAVTGPKVDIWLVKCVGVLVGVIGIVMGLAIWHDRLTAEIILLAMGSAAGLMAIDVIYVLKRVIDKIYLLDAAVELVLIAGWIVLWIMGR
jgi:hypothetical protein